MHCGNLWLSFEYSPKPINDAFGGMRLTGIVRAFAFWWLTATAYDLLQRLWVRTLASRWVVTLWVLSTRELFTICVFCNNWVARKVRSRSPIRQTLQCKCTANHAVGKHFSLRNSIGIVKNIQPGFNGRRLRSCKNPESAGLSHESIIL